jgi:hypothetical protein
MGFADGSIEKEASMKFLVLAGPAPIQPPPAVMADVMKAFKKWMAEQIKTGTVDCAFGYAAGGGGCGIVNASSGEELMELMVGSPLGPFSTFDLRPLADFNSGMDLAIKQLTAAAAAMG